MFKIIIPKATFKELEKIDSENQKLVYLKIKDLEKGLFTSDIEKKLIKQLYDAILFYICVLTSPYLNLQAQDGTLYKLPVFHFYPFLLPTLLVILSPLYTP